MLILKGSGAGIMQFQYAWRTPHPRFSAAALSGALVHADPEEVRYWKEAHTTMLHHARCTPDRNTLLLLLLLL
jgi:hypothetical protein